MFKYFIKNMDMLEYPVKEYSKFDWIKRKYLFELEKIKTYYRQRERVIDNKLILPRLIDLLARDPFMDDIEYFKKVSYNADYIAKQLNIVNNLNFGEVLENEIYNSGSYEILLCVTNELNLFELEDNWIELEPLRIIKTDNYNLDMNPVFDKIDFYMPNLTIFEIDIPQLMMMYKYWSKERIRNDRSTDPNVFIPTYVYPNILNNLLDLTIYNRYINIFKNETMDNLDNPHPFLIIDYTDKLDSILSKALHDTMNHNIPLAQLLNVIPVMNNTSMFYGLQLHKDIFNTQSYWVLVVARANYILDLLKIMGHNGIKRNLDIVNRLPVEIKEIERRTMYKDTKLPEYFQITLNGVISDISNIAGRR